MINIFQEIEKNQVEILELKNAIIEIENTSYMDFTAH